MPCGPVTGQRPPPPWRRGAPGSTGVAQRYTSRRCPTFTTVTISDNVQTITFDRTLRYVRYVGTVGGTSPQIPIAVVISEQKKQI